MSLRIFNIHDVFLIMTMGECILLALCRLALPSSLRIDNLMLGAFLITIAASIVATLLMWNDELLFLNIKYTSWLVYFSMGSALIRGPALYLYVHSLTQSNFSLRAPQLAHLLPLLFAFIYIGAFSLDSHDVRNIIANSQHFDLVSTLWYYMKFVSIAYALAALYSIWIYHRRLESEYSDFPRAEAVWLSVLVGGFFLNWLWSLSTHWVAKEYGGVTADTFGVTHNYIMFVLINALFIYSLTYTHSLFRVEVKTKKDNKKLSNADNIAIDEIEKVQKGVEENKMHLEGSINIEEFSRRIDLPVKVVSTVINRHFRTNFYEYINSHRISAAKDMLGDPKKSGLTILEILLASGFNNKSSFHRFFKRIVGVSPSEYRRNMREFSSNK
ncbi:MAG: AraC-like DNA-binding protein [Flavobacteriales bacterium]|jgi:AraC-like DNA-binding protein